MDVERKELEVQKAQQERDRFLLEMEHKYNLLDQGPSIDTKTGAVKKEVVPASNGKTTPQALLTTVECPPIYSTDLDDLICKDITLGPFQAHHNLLATEGRRPPAPCGCDQPRS
jgi:hypothetical protein